MLLLLTRLFWESLDPAIYSNILGQYKKQKYLALLHALKTYWAFKSVETKD